MSASTSTAARNTNGSRLDGFNSMLVRLGRGVGSVVGVLYQAGRDTIETVIRNILPFMAFIAVIVGIVNKTGIGDKLAHLITPLASSLPGLLGICIFCAIPVLSPILGPGAVILSEVQLRLGVPFEVARGGLREGLAGELLEELQAA